MSNIALICDDLYAMPTAVTIRSIINQVSRSAKYNVYVCTFSLSEENISRLESLSCEQCRVIVKHLDINDYQDKIKLISQRSHVTPSALIKFELPDIFPDLQRILYIDSDIIIKSSLDVLFDLDIKDYYLAASFELWKHLDNLYYNLNWNKHTDFYFNSGVLLINLQLMREDEISNKLWYYKIHQAKTTLMDQESFNAVCGSKTFQLGIKWNFNPIFLNAKFIKIINRIYSTSYKTVEDILEDAAIIHYVGKTDKPWVYESANLRTYWKKCYEDLGWQSVLTLEKLNNGDSGSPFWKIIIKSHGLKGLVCYVINRLLRRI